MRLASCTLQVLEYLLLTSVKDVTVIMPRAAILRLRDVTRRSPVEVPLFWLLSHFPTLAGKRPHASQANHSECSVRAASHLRALPCADNARARRMRGSRSASRVCVGAALARANVVSEVAHT